MPPVEDTQPHPMTVRPEGHKASCYNRGEIGKERSVQDGWDDQISMHMVGRLSFEASRIVFPNLINIPHTMSRKCRQGIYETLPECEGCTAEKDLEYIERMRSVK